MFWSPVVGFWGVVMGSVAKPPETSPREEFWDMGEGSAWLFLTQAGREKYHPLPLNSTIM